jgi:hypothetical protein
LELTPEEYNLDDSQFVASMIPDWLAERSQFKLSGPFERDLAPHRQRISVAFSVFLRMKGTRELKWAENTAELGL